MNNRLSAIATIVASAMPLKDTSPNVSLTPLSPIKHNGCQEQVGRLAVVDLRFHEHPQAGGCDDAEEKERHAAHDRCRYAGYKRRKLAGEQTDNGDNSRASDYECKVYSRNSQYANIFTIRRIRRGADEADGSGDAVAQHRPVQARIFGQVFSDDIACYDQMANMLGNNDQSNWSYGNNRRPVKFRECKGWAGEEGSVHR